MKIKYSEIFTSFQGEAGFAGMPTVWVRFFGCNLECNGFGQKNPMDPDTFVLPYKTVDLSNIKKMEDLPIFEYGCDSSYSWSNNFKSLVHTKTVEEVVDEIIRLGIQNFGLDEDASYYFWRHPKTHQKVQLCFTGGEPMLWQRQMHAILTELELRSKPFEQVTIETNGTKTSKHFDSDDFSSNIYMSVSPKLYSVSGERQAVSLTNIRDISFEFPGWLKFVINGSKESWEELDSYMNEIQEFLPNDWDVWIMPVGATKEQQMGSSVAEISNEAMRRGYKVATRNHAFVFGNIIGS